MYVCIRLHVCTLLLHDIHVYYYYYTITLLPTRVCTHAIHAVCTQIARHCINMFVLPLQDPPPPLRRHLFQPQQHHGHQCKQCKKHPHVPLHNTPAFFVIQHSPRTTCDQHGGQRLRNTHGVATGGHGQCDKGVANHPKQPGGQPRRLQHVPMHGRASTTVTRHGHAQQQHGDHQCTDAKANKPRTLLIELFSDLPWAGCCRRRRRRNRRVVAEDRAAIEPGHFLFFPPFHHPVLAR
jgi:hypothetical protein